VSGFGLVLGVQADAEAGASGEFQAWGIAAQLRFGRLGAVAQNLNVNAEMNQGEMTIQEVDAMFLRMGIPRPVWGPGVTIAIEAVRSVTATFAD
jgi:hypothetical protein